MNISHLAKRLSLALAVVMVLLTVWVTAVAHRNLRSPLTKSR